MKRTIVALLVLCLMVGFCACGNDAENGNYVKVFLADGNTETFASSELFNMITADAETYNSKYAENPIEMQSTITKVEPDYEMLGFIRVTFEDGWNCYIRKGTPIIDELHRGQNVKVTGYLIRDGYTISGEEITILDQQ